MDNGYLNQNLRGNNEWNDPEQNGWSRCWKTSGKGRRHGNKTL